MVNPEPEELVLKEGEDHEEPSLQRVRVHRKREGALEQEIRPFSEWNFQKSMQR